MSRIALRYYAGLSLVLLSRLVRRVLQPIWWLASFPERFAVIVWTAQEIDRYARADWNSWPSVRSYSRLDDWLEATEKTLVETYFKNEGALLNLACGAGREALLLARRGLKVMACDWSPRMVAEARRRAQETNLPVRFAVADMFNLPYREHALDYLLLTNIAYSYLFPRYRRLGFLRQAYSILKPGGVFIISFSCTADGLHGEGKLQRLFMKLRRIALLNRDFEPGDGLQNSFIHYFQPEELRKEFEEAKFLITYWLWKQGYAVLTKG